MKELVSKSIISETIKKSGEYKVGDQLLVNDKGWVDVRNLTPVTQQFSNKDSLIGFGDSCITEKGGVFNVIGFSDDGKKIVVTYIPPGSPMGTNCPKGVNIIFSFSEIGSYID